MRSTTPFQPTTSLRTSDLAVSGRVLLVDDDPQFLRTQRRALASEGLDVAARDDAETALEALRTDDFDCIVSDISMPGIDGMELLKAVRRQDLDIPVILVTGAPRLDTAIRALRYGAFDYILKPMSVEGLRRTVGHAIQIRRLARLKRQMQRISGLPDSAADLAGLEDRFGRALRQMYMAFQPILGCARREVVAYEALVRTREPSIPDPAALLGTAERLGRLHDLGRRIRAQVAARHDELDGLVFVNLHAADFADIELYDPREPLSKIAHRVVLEVTERASLDDFPDIRQRIQKLRQLGYRIAVDDLGAGYSGLNSFVDLAPDYVKLDRLLVDGIDVNPTKQRLVAAMSNLCGDLGIEVIAEGVETEAIRDLLVDLGVDHLQGYVFARPSEDVVQVRWA